MGMTLYLYCLGVSTITLKSADSIPRYLEAPMNIRIDTVFTTGDLLYLQARSAIIEKHHDIDALITASVYGIGTHAYGDLHMLTKQRDTGRWNTPEAIDSLRLAIVDSTTSRVFGDVTPGWHRQTNVVLATGKSFFIRTADVSNVQSGKRLDIENRQEVAYATYDPAKQIWSSLSTLDLPRRLKNGDEFLEANAGCTQRVDLEDGHILLPIRYKREGRYVSTVVKCRFDGVRLEYLAHADVFTIPMGRGLYEPSITVHDQVYYLTMRADDGAYVASSQDGLHFGDMQAWRFDNGEPLGSYNTQQHWLATPQGLFLVYTRKSENNGHVFRHRAPLFIGKVNPVTLAIMKATERVLMPIPEGGGDLGNFGVTAVSDHEFWVTAAVNPATGDAERKTVIQIAKEFFE